jgi:hypothetical protein
VAQKFWRYSAIAGRGPTGAVPLADMQIETESIDPETVQVIFTGCLYIVYTGAQRGARYGTDDSGMRLVGRLLVVVSMSYWS